MKQKQPIKIRLAKRVVKLILGDGWHIRHNPRHRDPRMSELSLSVVNGSEPYGTFRVSGSCINRADCDCLQYDGMKIIEMKHLPPIHDGCTCICEIDPPNYPANNSGTREGKEQ